MQDIHDIRGPVQVGIDPSLILIALAVLGGFLLLLLGFVWFKKWRKKHDRHTGLPELPKPMPPYDAALQSLDALLNIPPDDPRMFYFDLTMVLRKYMGDSFGTHAIEMTSQEFISSIRKLGIGDKIQNRMIEFYRGCDPFKYAGAAPESSRVKRDIESVRDLVTLVEAHIKSENDIQKGDV